MRIVQKTWIWQLLWAINMFCHLSPNLIEFSSCFACLWDDTETISARILAICLMQMSSLVYRPGTSIINNHIALSPMQYAKVGRSFIQNDLKSTVNAYNIWKSINNFIELCIEGVIDNKTGKFQREKKKRAFFCRSDSYSHLEILRINILLLY